MIQWVEPFGLTACSSGWRVRDVYLQRWVLPENRLVRVRDLLEACLHVSESITCEMCAWRACRR